MCQGVGPCYDVYDLPLLAEMSTKYGTSYSERRQRGEELQS